MTTRPDRPTIIDMFAGAGGLTIGFATAGYQIVGGNDNDPAALHTYQLNHPGTHTWPGSITDLDPNQILHDTGLEPGQLTVLAGGPPCQGFSKNRAHRHHQGQFIHDPRNHLFRDYLRHVAALQPAVVIIENVPEILTAAHGTYGHEIDAALTNLGYTTRHGIINTVDYGIPQRRKRALFIASRNGPCPLPQPTHTAPGQANLIYQPHVTVWDAISDLAGLEPGDGHDHDPYPRPAATDYQTAARDGATTTTGHRAWNLSPKQAERIRHLNEGDGIEALPPHLQPRSGYGSAYRRLTRNQPALTITTQFHNPGSGMYFHPTDNRTITIREAARLQSFPDRTTFHGTKADQCRQIGNAVPPLLAHTIAQTINQHLTRHHQQAA